MKEIAVGCRMQTTAHSHGPRSTSLGKKRCAGVLLRWERSPNGDNVLFISSGHSPGPRRADPSLLCHGPYSHLEDLAPTPTWSHATPLSCPTKGVGKREGWAGGSIFLWRVQPLLRKCLFISLSDLLTELSGYSADEKSTRAPGALTYGTIMGSTRGKFQKCQNVTHCRVGLSSGW